MQINTYIISICKDLLFASFAFLYTFFKCFILPYTVAMSQRNHSPPLAWKSPHKFPSCRTSLRAFIELIFRPKEEWGNVSSVYSILMNPFCCCFPLLSSVVMAPAFCFALKYEAVVAQMMYLSLHRRYYLSWQPFSVAQDRLLFPLLNECGHMWARPPPNVVWMTGSQMSPQCILDAFPPVLMAVHLWWDHSGLMLITGRKKASCKPHLTL